MSLHQLMLLNSTHSLVNLDFLDKEYHHQNRSGLYLFRIKDQELGIFQEEVYSYTRYDALCVN